MNYIDLSYVREVADGDDQFVAELIHSFILSTPSYYEEVRHRVLEKDRQELQAAAHRLKSAALNFGLTELVRMIKAIEEKAASEADWESLPPLLSKMSLVLEASLTELKNELEKFNRHSN